MDWEGQMVLKPNKVRVMIDDLPDSADLFSVAICAAEANIIDSLLDQAPCMNDPLSDISYDDLLPALVDTSSCPLEAINPVLDPLAKLVEGSIWWARRTSLTANRRTDDKYCTT